MNSIHKLQYKKIILESELLDIEEKIIQTFVEEHQLSFNSEIKKKQPDFQKKITNSPTNNSSINNSIQVEPDIENTETENQKIKKVYKEISKICHPDKSDNKIQNEIFVQAKKAYENKDFLSLLRLSDSVNLEFEIQEIDLNEMKKNLEIRKSNLIKLESTFLWMWVHAKSEEEKSKLIDLYIKQNS